MTDIQLDDKQFTILLTENQILAKIGEIARSLNQHLAGQNVDILVLLDGAKAFADALLPQLTFSYVAHYQQFKSYSGLASTGHLQYDKTLLSPLKGKFVLILEDIIDSGNTVYQLVEELKRQHIASIQIVSLLVKPEQIRFPVDINYSGFSLGSEFVVGFGMDYQELGRELRNIYRLKTS